MNFDNEKLAKIRNNATEIKKLILDEDKDLKNYLHSFLQKEDNQKFRDNSYDIGMYTVGFSPYPIFLSLLLINPKEKAILYYSEKSVDFKPVFESFVDTFGLEFELVHKVMKGSSDTAEVYNIIEEDIRKYRDKKISIDITGGKKPTVAAGFLGASLHEREIDIIYMDFDEYEDDRPVYGSEYLTTLLNPNYLFSTVERKALKELFESYQYRGARRLSKEILGRLKYISKSYSDYNIDYQINELEKIYYFSKLYELRNDFNYEECNIDEDILTEGEIKGLSILSNVEKRVNNIISELKIYKGDSNRYNEEMAKSIYNEFKDDNLLLYLALERYIGALRYKDIDYQSYILRLASVIELAGIMMFKGKYIRLHDKIKKFNDKNIRNKLFKLKDERNNSSLTHGFGSLNMPKEDYEIGTINYVCKAFKKGRKDIDKIIDEELKFRTFDEIICEL
ncbi:hypothetical protein KQH90_07125 [Anaerosalibacter bizertensis]|uniref:hypothetical protein n=1 Tax=Anaerosalibacter bizertensis TaxID=932217 RepID=UPI001C0EC301|nr:hypothetical protein [Anaerosalibacter bizertensis]MBU5293804.1 hypothetical protein [Anaerosalibacter bizertensis]